MRVNGRVLSWFPDRHIIGALRQYVSTCIAGRRFSENSSLVPIWQPSAMGTNVRQSVFDITIAIEQKR